MNSIERRAGRHDIYEERRLASRVIRMGIKDLDKALKKWKKALKLESSTARKRALYYAGLEVKESLGFLRGDGIYREISRFWFGVLNFHPMDTPTVIRALAQKDFLRDELEAGQEA